MPCSPSVCYGVMLRALPSFLAGLWTLSLSTTTMAARRAAACIRPDKGESLEAPLTLRAPYHSPGLLRHAASRIWFVMVAASRRAASGAICWYRPCPCRAKYVQFPNGQTTSHVHKHTDLELSDEDLELGQMMAKLAEESYKCPQAGDGFRTANISGLPNVTIFDT
jgi:hypothetical protein